MGVQEKKNIKDLLRLAEPHIMHMLATGTWHKVTALRQSVPEDLADARAGLSGEGSYCDIGRVNFGRLSLVHDLIMSLRQHDKCVTRGSGDQEEIRLIGIPCSAMNAAAHGDATTSLPLVPGTDTPPPTTTGTTAESTSVVVPSLTPLPPGPAVVPIDEIIVDGRFRKELGDIDALVRSIQTLGMLHDPVVRLDRHLVAGRRRLEALKRMGKTVASVKVVASLDDALRLLQAERDENECREAFKRSEAVALGKAIEAIEKQQAKQRQRDHGGTAPGRAGNTSGNLPGVSSGNTREKVAAAVGMSGRTYDHAKEVIEAAEESPEQFGHLAEEMDRTGKVNTAYKKLKSLQDPTNTAVDSESVSTTSVVTKPTSQAIKQPAEAQDAGTGVTEKTVSLKLSLKPVAMARSLVKALGQKKALQLAQALEEAVGTQKGQPRQRPRNSKTKVKKRTGQKRKLDRLPMTKPPRPGQIVLDPFN